MGPQTLPCSPRSPQLPFLPPPPGLFLRVCICAAVPLPWRLSSFYTPPVSSLPSTQPPVSGLPRTGASRRAGGTTWAPFPCAVPLTTLDSLFLAFPRTWGLLGPHRGVLFLWPPPFCSHPQRLLGRVGPRPGSASLHLRNPPPPEDPGSGAELHLSLRSLRGEARTGRGGLRGGGGGGPVSEDSFILQIAIEQTISSALWSLPSSSREAKIL